MNGFRPAAFFTLFALSMLPAALAAPPDLGRLPDDHASAAALDRVAPVPMPNLSAAETTRILRLVPLRLPNAFEQVAENRAGPLAQRAPYRLGLADAQVRPLRAVFTLIPEANAAVEVSPTDPTVGLIAGWLAQLLGPITGKLTWFGTVLMIVGALRVINKPLVSFLHVVVGATTTPRDDEVLAAAEASGVYKWFCWGLDWLFSLKAGPQAIAAKVGLEAVKKPA